MAQPLDAGHEEVLPAVGPEVTIDRAFAARHAVRPWWPRSPSSMLGAVTRYEAQEVTVTTIVVGVDDSDGARAALEWAAKQAKVTGGQLRVVHSFELNLAWIDGNNPEIATWVARARQVAEELLHRLVAGL